MCLSLLVLLVYGIVFEKDLITIQRDIMNKDTMIARIKQLEENVSFWRNAHLELSNDYFKFKKKVENDKVL